MRPQIDFSRTPTFQKFLQELWSTEGERIPSLVNGVLIDYHPVWRRFWSFVQSTGIDKDFDPWWELPPVLWPPASVELERVPSQPDPDWMPKRWEHLLSRAEKREGGPFLTKISVRPTRPDDPDIRTLRALADRQPFLCVVETRPIARVAASADGGGSITATHPGTLGGFLKDQRDPQGTIYGVTCAHVAQQTQVAVTLEDINGASIVNAGTVTHTSFGHLIPLQVNQHCNRQTTAVLEEMMEEISRGIVGIGVDMALIKLNGNHAGVNSVKGIGTVDEIFNSSQFGSGSSIEMRGNVSRHRTGYVGAYAVVYKVLFPNLQFYCFDHMFEIKTPGRFSSLIPPALGGKPVNGDSGAWICAANSAGNGNFAYCGTLVAVDGQDAYASFAETTRGWASAQGLDLVPF